MVIQGLYDNEREMREVVTTAFEFYKKYRYTK